MTKKERIAATITGIALFSVAALFSIGLLLGLLDFGSTNSRFLPAFGQMLLSVYGICSVLIPAFFFVAGSFCLSARWNIQRAFILLVSIIPFFTLVAAERISIAISNIDTSPLAFVKISSVIIIALLLVILEFLLAVTLATFIENRLKNPAGSEKKFKGISQLQSDKSATKDHDVQEIEWGSQYTNFPKADPKDYEDNGELEGSENADSATPAQDKKGQPSKSKLSFLKNKPAELKHMFVNKISFVNKKQEHKEKTAEINPDTKESAAEKKPAAKKISDFDNKQKETIKHSSAINWSIDDDGNIKGAKKEKELSVSEILSSNVPEEQTAEVKTSDQTVTDTSLASAEPETFADPESFEETEIKEADSLLDSDIPDIISFDDESVSSPDIDNDSDMDIIDQFEQESESLTADIENSIQNREHQEEISYDIDFEDPEENSEPENIQEDLPENFFADEQEKQIKDNDATVISDATTINEGNFEDTPSEEDFQNEQDVIEEDVYEEQPADTVQEDEIVQADNVNEIRYEQTEPADNQDSKPEISIEPDAEKDKTASFNPNATSLGDIFSQMEQDARQTVEGEELSGIQENAGTATAASANSSANNSTPAEVILPPKKKKTGNYKISTDLLTEYAENQYWIIDEETKQASLNLKETLKEFSIAAEITGIRKGPVVTMFEILPAPGVKLSKIVGLADNIALRLAAQSVRIVAPIPGKRAVGIEIPNKNRAIVSFRECIEQQRNEWKKMSVPVVLGKDIQGETQIIDLVKTPHLLIAGSTGAGKSVCVNSMILSILYKRSPSDVKLILIDPKVVELKLYNHIPHLLTPVITEPKKAMQALQYCLCEMERRYAVLDSLGCRDISSYNKKIVDQHIATEKIPYLIVIIDEFADLMATTGKQLEGVVARLCAMSRAVGIHLVLATQRPSVDVITGLIKANIPSRVAFMVAAKTDSRIIIDQVGAEKLLGKGDMLYASATDPFPVRIQGAFVSDQEVEDVVEAVKEWGEPEYIDDEIFVEDEEEESAGQMSLFNDGADDPLYDKALDIVIQAGKASASYIQRRLSIGYNRAARLVELMEERGIVGPANGSKPREIIHIP